MSNEMKIHFRRSRAYPSNCGAEGLATSRWQKVTCAKCRTTPEAKPFPPLSEAAIRADEREKWAVIFEAESRHCQDSINHLAAVLNESGCDRLEAQSVTLSRVAESIRANLRADALRANKGPT